MNWLPALPVALVLLGSLLGPGLAVTYAAGLRGVAAWGLAPAVSVASIALGAVLAGPLGVEWSPTVATGSAWALAAGVLLLRRLTRGSPAADRPAHRDGRRQALAAGAGMTVAGVLGALTTIKGIGSPESLSQTYDAVFHYNAVASIVATGDASSLTVGTLADPAARIAFYPAAWHGLVALPVMVTGASVPLASNVAALVIGTLVWPLSCLALIRQIMGRSTAALAVTPVVSLGFIAFPWSPMTFGVLWPNLLGPALLPAVLAAVVTVVGMARDSELKRLPALGWAAFGILGLGLAHPNTVFSLAALATFPTAWFLAAGVRSLAGRGRRAAAVGLVCAALVTAAVGTYFWMLSPLLAGLRAFYWPAYQSPLQAVGEVLLNATNGKDPAWMISLAVVAGAVVAARRQDTRWLIPAHLTSAMLFVVTSSSDSTWAAALTGVWYNDSFRLAAVLPITGVPLAVVGLLAVGDRIAAVVRADSLGRLRALRRRGQIGVATTGVLVLASGGLYLDEHAQFLTTAYPEDGGNLLTVAQREFVDGLGVMIPQDSVVAQNPWSGAALLFALTGREVLFPHLDGSWTTQHRYLAENLRNAAVDPEVCSAVQALGVGHALVGPITLDPWDDRALDYPGLEALHDVPGFELVAGDEDGFRLYRVTACEQEVMAS